MLKTAKTSVIPLLIITVIFGFIFFALSPLRGGFPLHDSAVFLSMGRSFLEGQILFRDIFDHKGPIIFLINALGLLIGFGSYYGVFLLQLVNLFLMLLVINKLFEDASPSLRYLAFAVTLLFLNHGLEGGNATEEYIALASMISVMLYFKGEKVKFFYVLQTLLLSYVFYIKPNGITVIASIMLIRFIEEFRWKEIGKSLMAALQFILTFGAVTGIFVGYFAFHGALPEFFDGLIFFNLKYISTSLIARIDAMITLNMRFTVELLVSAAALGVLFYKKAYKDVLKLVLTAGLTLFSIALAGRPYPHYFMIYLPVVIFSLRLIKDKISLPEVPYRILLIPTVLMALLTISPNGRGVPLKDLRYTAHLEANGVSKDMSAMIVGRVTQSRFFIYSGIPYQQKWFLALNHNIGDNKNIVAELLVDIQAKRPDLIVVDQNWYRSNQDQPVFAEYAISFEIDEDVSYVLRRQDLIED
jgi:hypothetical protein